MGEIRQNFGRHLKSLRKNCGFTQEQLSEKIGINQRQLTRIETGKSFPSFETLDAIISALNIHPFEIFDFDHQFELLCNGVGKNIRYTGILQKDKISLFEYLQNDEKSSFILETDSEENVRSLSKGIKKDIIVDYYNSEKAFIKSVVYSPDGSMKTLQSADENSLIFESLEKDLLKIKDAPKKLKFIKLAMDSLKSKTSAQKLQIMLDGMLI